MGEKTAMQSKAVKLIYVSSVMLSIVCVCVRESCDDGVCMCVCV